MTAGWQEPRPPSVPAPPIPAGVTYWHGQATGHWWAMLPGRQGPRLVEAVSEQQLALEVNSQLRAATR